MSTKTVAFIGIEKYEIIHYVSRVLFNLNKKVLLIDLSENKYLSYSIPKPNAVQKIVDYRGVDFTEEMAEKELLEKYDYVFIEYDFNIHNDELKKFDEVIAVTDLQIPNTKRLMYTLLRNNNATLIIKDTLKYKIDEKHIKECLFNLIQENKVYTIELDYENYKLKLDSLYNTIFKFNKCSRDMKETIYEIVMMLTEEEEINIKKAFRNAERGK